MFVCVSIIVCLTTQNSPLAKAQTASWDFSNPSDYSFDTSKIEVAGGVAQLKQSYTPGVDWIATDGGGHNWSSRRGITFDNRTSYLGVTSESLANFPVLVKLTSVSIDYAKVQDLGQDLRFTDSDGVTALKYEIEKWDETGTSYVWVKVPQIDINSNTDNIYMYYGNIAANDAQDKNNVWSNGYQMVQHMNDTTSTTVSDSANLTYTGTKRSAAGPVASTGQVGNGQLFTAASSDYIDYGNIVNPGTNSITIEAWYKTNIAGSADANILYNKENLYETAAGGGRATYAWMPHWNWDGGTAAAVTQGM